MTENHKNLRTNEVVRSRKIGGSVFIPLTGYIEAQRLFKVTRIDDKTVLIKEVKIVAED